MTVGSSFIFPSLAADPAETDILDSLFGRGPFVECRARMAYATWRCLQRSSTEMNQPSDAFFAAEAVLFDVTPDRRGQFFPKVRYD
jgi:hypothetical protein